MDTWPCWDSVITLSLRTVRSGAAIKRHLLDLRGAGPLFVLGTLSGLDYVLFIWSTQFIDISVSTVLFELWPLFLHSSDCCPYWS